MKYPNVAQLAFAKQSRLPRRRLGGALRSRPHIWPLNVNRLADVCINVRLELGDSQYRTRESTFSVSHRGLHRTELAQIRIRGFRALGENLIRIRSI